MWRDRCDICKKYRECNPMFCESCQIEKNVCCFSMYDVDFDNSVWRNNCSDQNYVCADFEFFCTSCYQKMLMKDLCKPILFFLHSYKEVGFPKEISKLIAKEVFKMYRKVAEEETLKKIINRMD